MARSRSSPSPVPGAPLPGARLTTFVGLLPKPDDVADYHYTVVHEMLEDIAANGTPAGDVLDPLHVAAHLERLKAWASELQGQLFTYAEQLSRTPEREASVASAA